VVGKRTLRSLAQFLELQDRELITLLLEKHGLDSRAVSEAVRRGTGVISALVKSLDAGGESEISAFLDEIAQTSGDLRNRVSPRYRYDERFADLERCLQLDGYVIADRRLLPLDPSIIGVPPVEDDLSRELGESGLPCAGDVAKKLSDSAEAFRSPTPNYNASLNDARIALQALATDIANARLPKHPGSFDPTKWGSVIAYLRATGFISEEEERGRNVSTRMRHPRSKFSVQLLRLFGDLDAWLSTTAVPRPAGALRHTFGRATRSPGCGVNVWEVAGLRRRHCRGGRSWLVDPHRPGEGRRGGHASDEPVRGRREGCPQDRLPRRESGLGQAVMDIERGQQP
jgi:hypothetical protein